MLSSPMKMTVVPGSKPGQMVLQLDGPLTLNNIFSFQDSVRADRSAMLIIDLSAVPYIDSAGIGALVAAHVSRQRDGRKLVLAGTTERVSTALQVTQVAQLFKLFPTLAEAESSFS
ncbi:MAG: STAS domain-containing protein [Terriglobales bacterium]